MLKQHLVTVLLVITVSSLIQADGFAADQLECLTKNNAKPEDLQHLTNLEGSEENILCAMKCIWEVDKIIDEDGNINADNIENCETLSKLPDEQKTQLKECLSKIDKIETCQDMMKTNPCGEGLDL